VTVEADDTPTAPPTTVPITVDSALDNAARILNHAELETNLPLMERLEHLADSWIAIACTVAGRE
jgi:hypothetical protein